MNAHSRPGDGDCGDPLTNAQWVTETERQMAEWNEPQRQATLRLWKAIMLARTIDDCVDLLNGVNVPLDRLRPEWVQRFGGKA